jgi:hypothetical protein
MVVQSTTATVHEVSVPISNADLPKWVVRQAFKTFETGNVADVDTFCHADYRNHEAPEHAGPEGFRAMVSAMRHAFSSLSYEEQRIICQGDTVVLWTVMRASTRRISRSSPHRASRRTAANTLGSGAGWQASRTPRGPR